MGGWGLGKAPVHRASLAACPWGGGLLAQSQAGLWDGDQAFTGGASAEGVCIPWQPGRESCGSPEPHRLCHSWVTSSNGSSDRHGPEALDLGRLILLLVVCPVPSAQSSFLALKLNPVRRWLGASVAGGSRSSPVRNSVIARAPCFTPRGRELAGQWRPLAGSCGRSTPFHCHGVAEWLLFARGGLETSQSATFSPAPLPPV